MSRVPVLRELKVSCYDASVHLGWRWAGRAAQVRVLRSTECFCDSPESHLTGEWSQDLIYEGSGSQILDGHAARDHDVYYSIFARRGARGAWRRPIRVCVRKAGHQPPALGRDDVEGGLAAALYAPGRVIGDRYVEIAGSEEPAPAVRGARGWLLIVVPAGTLGVLMGFLRGVDVRLLTVAGLALAACWRLLDGAQPDFRRLLAYLRVVAVVDGFFWAAALLVSSLISILPASQVRVSQSVLLFWLYPLLLIAGMAGVWLFMSFALDGRGRPAHLVPFVVLAAVLGAAALLPAAVCALAAAYAVWEYVHARLTIRKGHAARQAALAGARRQTTRDLYTPWLAQGDEAGPATSTKGPS